VRVGRGTSNSTTGASHVSRCSRLRSTSPTITANGTPSTRV
jgi:hypothetical protein